MTARTARSVQLPVPSTLIILLFFLRLRLHRNINVEFNSYIFFQRSQARKFSTSNLCRICTSFLF